jgi:hypothetical protein
MPGLVRLKDDDTRAGQNACGYTVKNNTNDKIGKVNTVIVDADSFATCYIVIEASGLFLTHKYVIRADEITGISDDDKTVYIAGISNDKLKSGVYEEFDESWWARHNSRSEGLMPPETPARAYPATIARDGEVTNQLDAKHRMNQGGEPGRSDERVSATEAMMHDNERRAERGIPGSAIYSGENEGPHPNLTDDRVEMDTASSLQPEGPSPAADDMPSMAVPARHGAGGTATPATLEQHRRGVPSQGESGAMDAQQLGPTSSSTLDGPGSPVQGGLGDRGSSANPDGSDSPITP